MILFVCTGNTCRSPLAQAIAALHGVEADSAGLSAFPGAPASRHAQMAIQKLGGDLSAHRAQIVSESLLQKARLIFPMTESHALVLRQYFPAHAHKIRLLSPQIPDPFGGNLQEYEACAHQLTLALQNAGIIPMLP